MSDHAAQRRDAHLSPAPSSCAFAWRHGNEFRLLTGNREFFGSMLQAIERARRYVLLEMYLVESGRIATAFIDALERAARRGAEVKVLFDAFGALGLDQADRGRLAAAGIELCFYNRLRWRKGIANLARNHRKLLLVDGEIAFVGGAGLADEFAARADGGAHWRDLMLEIRGPVVADWQALFSSTWLSVHGAPLTTPAPCSPGEATGAAGRVAISDGWHRAQLADTVVHRIETARDRVWLVSAYFLPSRRFRKALRRAVRRGVDVRVLVPGARTDHPMVRHATRRFFGKLLSNGVRVFEYQPRVLHAKMAVCDDWVSVGSSNLDRWGFKWNLEANQEVEHRPFANFAACIFETDCRQALELDVLRWRHRHWADRLRERVAGMIDRVLERWRRPSQPRR